MTHNPLLLFVVPLKKTGPPTLSTPLPPSLSDSLSFGSRPHQPRHQCASKGGGSLQYVLHCGDTVSETCCFLSASGSPLLLLLLRATPRYPAGNMFRRTKRYNKGDGAVMIWLLWCEVWRHRLSLLLSVSPSLSLFLFSVSDVQWVLSLCRSTSSAVYVTKRARIDSATSV